MVSVLYVFQSWLLRTPMGHKENKSEHIPTKCHKHSVLHGFQRWLLPTPMGRKENKSKVYVPSASKRADGQTPQISTFLEPIFCWEYLRVILKMKCRVEGQLCLPLCFWVPKGSWESGIYRLQPMCQLVISHRNRNCWRWLLSGECSPPSPHGSSVNSHSIYFHRETIHHGLLNSIASMHQLQFPSTSIVLQSGSFCWYLLLVTLKLLLFMLFMWPVKTPSIEQNTPIGWNDMNKNCLCRITGMWKNII